MLKANRAAMAAFAASLMLTPGIVRAQETSTPTDPNAVTGLQDTVRSLTEAAPVWTRLLRPGGALGISWNTHVAKRADAAAVLAAAGLTVLEDGPYGRFEHRVDQAITRDILVAVRPATA